MPYIPLSQTRANLGLKPISTGNSSYTSLDQARTQLLTANAAKPKQVSAPSPTISKPKPITQPQPNNFITQVSKAPVIGQALQIVKNTAQQGIEFGKSLIKTAIKEPKKTALGLLEGGAVSVIKSGAEVAKLVQDGFKQQPIIGIGPVGVKPQIPDRWDMSKQLPAFNQLVEQKLKEKPISEQNGFAVGNFLGSFLPYAVTSELTGATIGSKILLPTAEKFLPQAVKFIPKINDVIGFLGVGQLEYDKSVDKSRVDRAKNDLIMLGLFEIGGVLAKGLSKGTQGIISKVVNTTAKDIKNTKGADLNVIEQSVTEVKDAIKQDTGKSAEVILANNMVKASDNEIKSFEKLVEKPPKPKEIISEQIIGKEVKGKPPFTAKEAQAVQKTFSDELSRISTSISNQKQLVNQSTKTIDETVNKLKGDRVGLAGIRTAINKEMFGFVGAEGKPYKQAYAELQTEFDNPEIGNYLKLLDSKVKEIDDLIKTTPAMPIKVITERPIQQPIGKGETKVSRLALKVEAKAIEKKLTDSLGDLPEFRQVNMKSQGEMASNLVNKDLQKAIDIALGKKTPPANLLPESVYVAVENKAIAEGNLDLIRQLAISVRTTEATAMGQRIRALAERNNNSPVSIISDIVKTREEAFKERFKGRNINQITGDMVKKAKSYVKVPDHVAWNDFLDSIQC